MRVCFAHKVQAVETLKSIRDDSEHDLCPECLEAFRLIVSGAFFEPEQEEIQKRGRPKKTA
jgi:hypothetical protein